MTRSRGANRNARNSTLISKLNPWAGNLLNTIIKANFNGNITTGAVVTNGRYIPIHPNYTAPLGTSPSGSYNKTLLVGNISTTLQLFASYFIRKVTYDIIITNSDTFPKYVTLLPVPSTQYTTFGIVNYNNPTDILPGASSKVLNMKGSTGDKIFMRKVIDIAKLEGISPQLLAQDSYACTSTVISSDKQLLYLQVIAIDGSSPVVGGIDIYLKATFEVTGRQHNLVLNN